MPSTPRQPSARLDAPVLVAVGIGGAPGARPRHGLAGWDSLGAALDLGWGGPAGTILIVNVAGSFLMGLLVCWVLRRPAPRLLRPLIGTGVLGGFTTFSTFAYDVRALAEAGEYLAAASYLVLTPALAIGACWLGVLGMHYLLGGPLPTPPESGDLPGAAPGSSR